MARIGIAGAGFQGRTVGYRLALGGHQVVLYDPSAAQLERALAGMKSRRARALVETAGSLDGLAGCELVVENVPEELALKRRVLAALEAAAPGAIVASNSSSFPPDELAVGLRDPARFLNLHFLGPGYGNDVLEVAAGRSTAAAVVASATAMLAEAGLDPVPVRPCVALVFNRVSNAGVAAIGRSVDAGLLALEDLVRYALPAGQRMRQLDVLDHVGLDIISAVLESCRVAYGPRFAVPRWMAERVAAGHFGVKSGQGLLRHEGEAVALAELPLSSAARPLSPFRAVAVRGPSHLTARLLGALLGRADRRLLLDAAEAPPFLAAVRETDPRTADAIAARAELIDLGASTADLLLDARVEALEDKRGALATLGERYPTILVCSPLHARADLAGATGAHLGVMGTLPGFGGLAELVRAPGQDTFRDLLLEVFGRCVEVGDGPVRPIALLAVPRLLEARMVVDEGVASADSVRRIMGGEDLLAEARSWGDDALTRVAAAIRKTEPSLA